MIGLPDLDVIGDVLHLFVGQVAEAREDDHQIGRCRALPGREYCCSTSGLMNPVFGIDGEQDGAFEAVVLGQDLGHLRQALPRSDIPRRR